MDINEIKQAIENADKMKKELSELIGGQSKTTTCESSFFEINEKYLIRTVTMTLTGKLIGVSDKELLYTILGFKILFLNSLLSKKYQ